MLTLRLWRVDRRRAFPAAHVINRALRFTERGHVDVQAGRYLLVLARPERDW